MKQVEIPGGRIRNLCGQGENNGYQKGGGGGGGGGGTLGHIYTNTCGVVPSYEVWGYPKSQRKLS